MSFLSRLKDIIGLEDQNEYVEYDYEYADVDKDIRAYSGSASPNNPTEVANPRSEATRVKGNNAIGMPRMSHGNSEMVLIEPHAFEEMPQVIDALRQQKSVILNMTLIRQEEAQRSVDFVAGGTYAIDGHYERIGDNIFLFTPNCVQVSTPSNVMTEVITAPVRSSRSVNPGGLWASEPIAQ